MDEKRNTSRKISVSGKHMATTSSSRQSSSQQRSAVSSTGGQRPVPSYSSTGKIQQIINPPPVKEAPSRSAKEFYTAGSKKRTLYIVCTALAAISVIVAALMLRNMTEQESYNNYYSLGYSSFQAGDYDSALTALRKAYGISDTVECASLMADCYESQLNYDKALMILRQIKDKDDYIYSKISHLEAEKDKAASSEKITVAGRQYSADTSSISLKDGAVTDATLSELTQLYSLTALTLSGNGLCDISPLSHLTGLSTLDLSGNCISDLTPLSALSSLRTLYLDGNLITDFTPLYHLTSLTTLSIKGIEITDVELKKLTDALPACAIHSESAQKTVNDISIGGTTFKADVSELNLSGFGLHDISVLSSCKNLKKLDISGNSIIDLSPLMDILSLETLIFNDNQVVDIRPLMAMTNLRYINAENNMISNTVPLSTLTNLSYLYLSGNPITDFSGLASIKYLKELALDNTGLQDDDLVYLENLQSVLTLRIKDNPALTGDAFDKLNSALSRTFIEHSELIRTVELGGEKFNDDVLEVNLENKSITDISAISSFKKLERLNLRNNSISNIYMFQYLKSELKFLDLSNNNISDITAISGLLSLEELDLSFNEISSVTQFFSLTNLKRLVLTGNQLTEEQISDLSWALPGCEIICDTASIGI